MLPKKQLKIGGPKPPKTAKHIVNQGSLRRLKHLILVLS
jgi:hypothetical protein